MKDERTGNVCYTLFVEMDIKEHVLKLSKRHTCGSLPDDPVTLPWKMISNSSTRVLSNVWVTKYSHGHTDIGVVMNLIGLNEQNVELTHTLLWSVNTFKNKGTTDNSNSW